MKAIVFKSAWSIFRMENVTFSQALTKAWKNAKANIKAVIVKSNRLVKSVGLGFDTVYFNELIYTAIKTETIAYNNDGAQAWYDGKTFNND